MTLYGAIELYKEQGGHFFDADTMKFWKSRNASDLINDRYFITSERNFDDTCRLYTLRAFNADYSDVETLGDFQGYKTLRAAKKALAEIMRVNA